MSVLLSHEEAAGHLGVCAKTLRVLRQRGLVRYVAITERLKKYRVEDLDDFLAGQVRQEVQQSTSRRRSTRLSRGCNVVSFTARRQARKAAGRG